MSDLQEGVLLEGGKTGINQGSMSQSSTGMMKNIKDFVEQIRPTLKSTSQVVEETLSSFKAMVGNLFCVLFCKNIIIFFDLSVVV